MKKYTRFLFLLFLISPTHVFAEVTASVESSSADSPIVLTITSNENSSVAPDLSVLKDLFNVVSTSVSRQSYIVNGQAQSETQWRFSLIALKNGISVIPSIVVGNERTNPVSFSFQQQSQSSTLASSNENDSQTTEPLYHISTELYRPNSSVFVNEQMIYKVFITDNGSLDDGEPSFESTGDFIIKPLGKPQIKQINPSKRQIIYSFALFAQKSGDLTVPKVVFNGVAYQKPDVQNIFQIGPFHVNIPSIFGVETPVRLEKEGPQIKVLPVLKDYPSSWWIPARNVTVSAKILDNQKITQDIPFSREITVTAQGVTDTQLPELEFSSTEDIRAYPEKPVGETIVSGDTVTGIQKTIVTYVPKKSGEITLEPIKIDWFNTLTNSRQVAASEKESIFVLPNSNINHESTAPFPVPQEKQNLRSTSFVLNPFFIALIAFFAGIFLAFLFLRKTPDKHSNQTQKDIHINDLALSAKKNDLKTLRNNLILWTQKNFKGSVVSNLRDVSRLFDDQDLDQMIDALSKALYQDDNNAQFNAKRFMKTFKNALKKRKKHKKQNEAPIPPLYS